MGERLVVTQPRKRPTHLRLVVPAGDLPPVLTDPAARKEFERLTQELVDIAIEITDVLDGDPDLEPDGDEREDDDGF